MNGNKRKNKRRGISILLIISAMAGMLSLFSCTGTEADARPRIVCTTFVLADWTREVLGDDADSFSIELLGANGADIHSYQPTVKDITLLSRCDVFIHIGGESDAWANDTLSSAANENMTRLDLSHALSDELCTEEHTDEGHEHAEVEHHFDEHIWFSFSHTRHSVEAIAKALGERYPEKKDMYFENAQAYEDEISSLEEEYKNAVSSAKIHDIVVADRYPFAYLFDSLEIKAHAAFSGCSAESEASFEVIARLSGKIDELSLSYIIKCEDSRGNIAESVKNNAKTKNIKVLTLNSLQSQGKAELRAGVSYILLMKDNLQVIKAALSAGE